MLSMRNKNNTAQPHNIISFAAHAYYVPSSQTDTWTDGHTDTQSNELLLNKQMWGSLTLVPNNGK